MTCHQSPSTQDRIPSMHLSFYRLSTVFFRILLIYNFFKNEEAVKILLLDEWPEHHVIHFRKKGSIPNRSVPS